MCLQLTKRLSELWNINHMTLAYTIDWLIRLTAVCSTYFINKIYESYKTDVKIVTINLIFLKHILCSGFITKAIKYNSNIMITNVRTWTNKFYSTFPSTVRVHVMLQKKLSISIHPVYFRTRIGKIQIFCNVKVMVYQKYASNRRSE
jgi:hypothetical protein